MLRFLPDGWLEGALRPFLLADPVAGLYLELAAPDWRFGLLIVFLLAMVLSRSSRPAFTVPQRLGFLSLALMFYIWTFAIGNGRYFLAGLLLAGPLLMVAWRQLPGTLAFRSVTLLGLIGLQAFTVQLHFIQNVWGLLPWREGPGLPVQASRLREEPAIFLTITGISYSLLVPRFHPLSRWANIAGQRAITPRSFEHGRLQMLLASPLPKYVLMPSNPGSASLDGQPIGPMRELMATSLAAQGLSLTAGAVCSVLRSPLSLGVAADADPGQGQQAFWVCPVMVDAPGEAHGQQAPMVSDEQRDAFEHLERRCPRYFPSGDSTETRSENIVMRHYASSDTHVYIDGNGQVLYKYFRSVNSTLLGTVDDVRHDRYRIDCDKLPGRYQLPWRRD